MTAALAGVTLAAWILAVGALALPRAGRLDGERMAAAFGVGALLAWATLVFLDEIGLGWSRAVLGAAGMAGLVGAAAIGRRTRRAATAERGDRTGSGGGPGLGDVIACAAWALHALAAWRLWNLHPDFVFHWGVKAGRFVASGGVDWVFLSRPWNEAIHPGYPDLVTDLTAASWMLAGSRDERTVAVLAAVLFGVLLLGCRALFARLGADRVASQAGLAVLAWAVVRFVLADGQTGGADWWLAVACVLGALAIASPRGTAGDLGTGLAGALAAAAKLEGAALGPALAVGRWIAAPPRPAGRREIAAFSLRTLGLPLAAVGLWQLRLRLHGVPVPSSDLVFSIERTGVVLSGLAAQLVDAAWWGAPLVLVVALPWALGPRVPRRVRGVATAVSLQLAFYAGVYLFVGVEPVDQWIGWSARRLLFHVLPVGLVLATLLAAGRRPDPDDGPQPAVTAR